MRLELGEGLTALPIDRPCAHGTHCASAGPSHAASGGRELRLDDQSLSLIRKKFVVIFS
jgi:hypothetical protein